jgi:HSP90 family molecular chaperone
VLKEGVGEDHANKERIAKLLRFRTTQADEETVSLADYLGRMKEGQDKIYYLTADTLAAAKASPHLEVFRKKGVEVLLLADRVDEWLVSNLFEFEGKSLASVAKGQVDLSAIQSEGEDKEEPAKAEEEARPLLERLKKSLESRAKDVRASHRLVESPACLVADEGDMNANLARMLKSMGQAVPETTAHPGGEPGPSLAQAPGRRGGRALRRTGRPAAGSGGASGRRPARRPGGLRETGQRAAVRLSAGAAAPGPGRRGSDRRGIGPA